MKRKEFEESIKNILKEEFAQLDTRDVKIALKFINAMYTATAELDYSTNRELKSFADKVRKLQPEIMDYVEKNSGYSFYPKRPSGFKVVPNQKIPNRK